MEWSVWANAQLEAFDAQGLKRSTRVMPESGGRFEEAGREILNFASNDYLNLGRHPRVIERAAETVRMLGLGSGSARLVSGTLALHEQAEHSIAQLTGSESVLLFSSGYLANIGLLSGICTRDDVVVSDRAVHASVLDGIMLSRADSLRFQHNDVEHAEKQLRSAREKTFPGRLYLVTEAVFSMDGDVAPLAELAQLARSYEAELIVDQAHAIGVYGTHGSGVPVDGAAFISGTLSKALGAYGGFVGGPQALRDLLISRSRPFIFNTSLPVSILAGAIAAIELVTEDGTLGTSLLERAAFFRDELTKRGLNTLGSSSHIVPVLVPGNAEVIAFSARLRELGILVPAIRKPTVPQGAERLRFSLTLAHEKADLTRVAELVAKTAEDLRGTR